MMLGGLHRRTALLLSFLLPASVLIAQQPNPRQPRGVYAVVNVEQIINQQQKANPSITPAQLDAYLDSYYLGLLQNPAVAGLTLQVHWDTLNPNPPSAANAYQWNTVDDAFAQAAVWSTQNPGATPKTIQLIVTPGFNSPQWLLSQIPSCDGLFQSPVQTPPGTCGLATFQGYNESGDSTTLPLPWNPVYKSAWQVFLIALAARYGPNPAFVSIAVSGPTAASAEMIVPNNGNSNNPQTQFGVPIAPTAMWRQLLAFRYPGMPAYLNSDQAFIDEWNAAIDLFGTVFSGLTLVATTGNGLPSFGANFTVPTAFTADCGNPNMDCAAETTILSHFVEASVGGANGKSTQTSGMEASRGGIVNLGVAGLKQLAQVTAGLTSPSSQILGGAQFNTSFSADPVGEGCTSTFPPDSTDTPPSCTIPPACTTQGCVPVACIPQSCLAPGVTPASLASFRTFNAVPSKDLIPPEQSEYNVLSLFFSGTPVASYFSSMPGTAPLNYLQVYSPDIQYATANAGHAAEIIEPGGATVLMSAQDMLNLASEKLLELAEPFTAPAITGLVSDASFTAGGAVASGSWVAVFGSGLAPAEDTRPWNTATEIVNGALPVNLDGTSVTVNGKPAAVAFISPTQVNIETPDDTAIGPVPVVIETAAGKMSTFTVNYAQFAPGLFPAGSPYIVAQHADNSYVTTASPAMPGEVIVLWGTGFGAANPPVPSGKVFSGANPLVNPVTVTLEVRLRWSISPES
jgi:uncharacterized protein (TIGR03437 family)